MKDTEYAFAVAKVRANENRLLSKSNFESLICAKDYDTALKILSDAGYGEFLLRDADEILSEKQSEIYELVYSCSPDKSCIDFLIVKNDFHNAKAILKSMITNNDAKKYYISPSVIVPEDLETAIKNKSFSKLPEFLAQPCQKAYDILVKTLDGQLSDVILDRAALEAQILLSEKSGERFSVGLAKLMAALYDIKIALRASARGKELLFYEYALANTDLIDIDELSKAALKGTKDVLEYAKAAGFEREAESFEKSQAAFEKSIDDELTSYVSGAKYTSLGISPLIAFCLVGENQIKSVRIILSCKKNGFDEQSIRERVRVQYE